MDVFRFLNPNNKLLMEQGKIINGIRSKMWIERYLEAGEFEFIAPVSSGIMTALPIGSFVSHTDTRELMIVENQEVNQSGNGEAEVTVTGRSFETILENRIIGSNRGFPSTLGTTGDYLLEAMYIWNQALYLMQDHILASNLINDDNALPYVTPSTAVTASGTYSPARSLKLGTVYKGVLDILDIDNLGIKSLRPGSVAGYPQNVVLQIHNGVNRTGQVTFSHNAGNVKNADYLWSNKNLKNAAIVYGRWVMNVVLPTEKESDRRFMIIDASDLDQKYTAAPTGTTFTSVANSMATRGQYVLRSQKGVNLIKAEVSKEDARYQYRDDYNVGDTVYVAGEYQTITMMQVSEHVEMEDEHGENSYPTFDLLPDPPPPSGRPPVSP